MLVASVAATTSARMTVPWADFIPVSLLQSSVCAANAARSAPRHPIIRVAFKGYPRVLILPKD
jgi:hypothetical protein